VGERAPSFSLPNHDGKVVSLADLAGQWVVLYFYPRDDTPGCTQQASEFSARLDDFRRLNARVVGISPDSVAQHREFREKHDLHVELLSDPDHAVLQQFGAWGEKSIFGKRYEGVLRSTILLRPQGCIAHYWPIVSPVGHADEVAQTLAALQADG
jgi:peroxiredoxin Q/BCP